MREVLSELVSWWEAGETIGMGTVVATWRSAPRPAGAAMLVGPGGQAVGSVSGGCVEGALYELCEQVVADGRPVLQRYGVSDDDAYAVGLTCGGILDVFVEPVSRTTFPELAQVAAEIEAHRPVAVATVIEHPDPAWLGRRLLVRPGAPGEAASTVDAAASESAKEPASESAVEPAGAAPWTADRAARHTDSSSPKASGTLGSPRADAAVTGDALGLLAAGRSETLGYGPDGERRGEGMRVFVASFAPRPRMLVFGAIDFAAAVARVGSFLGYRVSVCDARPVFATRSRFPDADEVIVRWPHDYLDEQFAAGLIDERTVICVLTHDPKFDVPVLTRALRLPAVGYIGAMGSRRTHADRTQRLLEAGLTEADLARLASPIGLDLGARTPEETAISIAAEIIALRWGGAGERLSGTGGPIHHERPPDLPDGS